MLIGCCVFFIQLDAFRRHFSAQLYHYPGRHVLINLVSCYVRFDVKYISVSTTTA